MSSKYNKLADKHVLILGGSLGIGLAVAEATLSAGAHVVISSSAQSRVDKAVADLRLLFPSRTITGLVADLSRPSIETDLETLLQSAGPLDHIVYTAADALALGGLDSVAVEVVHKVAHMRLVVPLLLGKVARKYLPTTRASSLTITTGSVAEKPSKGWALVAFMAGGNQTLAKALALDMAPVRVNVVRPGIINTGLWDHNMSVDEKAGMLKGLDETMLTGRAGQAEDVAEAYLWLMKDGNATGTVAGSDGGALLV